MEQRAEIFYTDTFTKLTDQLIAHLTLYMTEDRAIEKVLWAINQFEHRVRLNPLSCQISPHLANFGIQAFREFVDQDYRIFYHVDEEGIPRKVYVHAILSQKQDMEKVLNDHCLIYTDVNPNQLV